MNIIAISFSTSYLFADDIKFVERIFSEDNMSAAEQIRCHSAADILFDAVARAVVRDVTNHVTTGNRVQLKLLFTISVFRDRLLFMTKIPCTDHFVQKSLCGERLPVERDQ